MFSSCQKLVTWWRLNLVTKHGIVDTLLLEKSLLEMNNFIQLPWNISEGKKRIYSPNCHRRKSQISKAHQTPVGYNVLHNSFWGGIIRRTTDDFRFRTSFVFYNKLYTAMNNCPSKVKCGLSTYILAVIPSHLFAKSKWNNRKIWRLCLSIRIFHLRNYSVDINKNIIECLA